MSPGFTYKDPDSDEDLGLPMIKKPIPGSTDDMKVPGMSFSEEIGLFCKWCLCLRRRN